jgi:hypothetical protein
MGVELNSGAKPPVDEIQNQLAEGLIRECHQHAAMHDTAVVDVARIRPECEYPAAILQPLKDGTGEMRKIVGDPRLPFGIYGRGHESTFHWPGYKNAAPRHLSQGAALFAAISECLRQHFPPIQCRNGIDWVLWNRR